MFGESVRRLLRPEAIQFSEALPVAIVGLLVNLASVKLLDADDHVTITSRWRRPRAPPPRPQPARRLFHVLADAFTSVLAIAALVGGRYAGWKFLDPLMGIVGGAVILRWSVGLCRGAARQLLDMVSSPALAQTIRKRLEVGDVRVADLHLWELAPGRRGCIVSLVTEAPEDTAVYKSRLDGVEGIAHLTVEVQRCPGH